MANEPERPVTAPTLDPLDTLSLDSRAASAIIEATADGIAVINEPGEIVLANAALERMFGLDRMEMLGRTVECLIPERYRAKHGAHRLRYRADPRSRPMGTTTGELVGLRSDGAEFPVEISLSPLRSGDETLTIAVVRDVTERRAADASMRRVLRTLDGTIEAVFLFEVDTYRFVYVNEGAVRQTGYDRAALLTMSPAHLAPEFPRAKLDRLLGPLCDGQRALTLTTSILREDGSEVPVELSVQYLQTDDLATPLYVAFGRDITERLRSAEQLRQAEQEMGRLADRERIARDLHDRIIQRLFATSLSLQATASRAGGSEVAARLERAVDELDETIREIRTVIFGLHQRGSDATSVREAVLALCRQAARGLGFEPGLVFDGPVDTLVDDGARTDLVATLREALSNVSRHARASRVEVAVSAGAELVLVVRDDGIGVDPDGRSVGDGIDNMRCRAAERGGTFDLRRHPEGGTVLEWRIPLEDR